MWAQRMGSQAMEHDTMAFEGDTADDVAAAIHDRCSNYCVRVAHIVAYATVVHDYEVRHHAIVTFEREPQR